MSLTPRLLNSDKNYTALSLSKKKKKKVNTVIHLLLIILQQKSTF